MEAEAIIVYAAAFILQSDQNMLAPHLSAIAKEFGMSEEDRDKKLGGQLALGLFLIGAPAALFLGNLGDYMDRTALLVGILVVGGVASLGTAACSSFLELFWWRALTGVSLGAALPITFSLLGDLYPPSKRTVVSGRVGIAMSAGQGAGLLLSGFVGSWLGWRAPFVVAAAAFFQLALVVSFFMNEPKRGRYDLVSSSKGDIASAEQQHREETTCKKAKALCSTRSVWILFAQGIPGCIPWSVITVFLADYLHSELLLSVKEAATVLAIFSLGTFFGMICGGEVGQRLYNRRVWMAASYSALAEALGAVPLAGIVLYATPRTPLAFYFPASFVGGFLASQTGVFVRSSLQNVVAPTHRALAFGTFAIFDDIGKGGGPVVVANLIGTFGRRRAFGLAICVGWLAGAMVNSLLCFTLESDEIRLAKNLRKNVLAEEGNEYVATTSSSSSSSSTLELAARQQQQPSSAAESSSEEETKNPLVEQL